MYETILWAHDGSEIAADARHHVATIAKAFESHVIVCHVVELIEGAGVSETRPAEGVTYSTRLEAAATELREDGVQHIETIVLQGSPSRALADLALEREAGLIVVTTRGRGTLARAVLGSVSDQLARTTPGIPVLVVHPTGDDT